MRWRSSLAAVVVIASFVGIYWYALRDPPPPKPNPHMEPIPDLFLPEEDPEDSTLLFGGGVTEARLVPVADSVPAAMRPMDGSSLLSLDPNHCGPVFFANWAAAQPVVRVTAQPVRIHGTITVACFTPIGSPRAPSVGRDGPHFESDIDVYVSADGLAAMNSANGKFPQGTVILKRKFRPWWKVAKKTDLFTGMLKREAGYNPDCGDWEFFVVDGAGERVTALGKLQNCMNCHKQYADRDYVTKEYMKFE